MAENKPLHELVKLRATSILLAIVVMFSCAMPFAAQGLEIERWTAKSNQDGDRGVMSDTPTRVTWQGQSDPDESIAAVTLDFPEGTQVQAENVKVTVLDGLDRVDTASEVSVAGGNVVTVTFPDTAQPGTMIMLECNRTVFPAIEESVSVMGNYVTADGQTHDMPATDKTITVVPMTITERIAGWLAEQPFVQAWNSNKLLHLFLDPTIIVTSVPVVFSGWLISLALVVISFPLAIPLGLMWSFLRMAKHRIFRAIGATYINIVRGTPLFLQIYIAFFALPLMGIKMDSFVIGAIVLILNSSAYLAEIFRAGIQSISKGQFEASRSLGMNGAQTMIFVIIPQTVRRVIPTMTSEFILMYKDTSLLAAVGVMEIMMYSKTITAATGNVTPYIVAAMFYLIVTIPLTKLINTMEARLGNSKRRKRTPEAIEEPSPTELQDEAEVARSLRMSETLSKSPAVYAADNGIGKKRSGEKKSH